jgi:hypothetical protein
MRLKGRELFARNLGTSENKDLNSLKVCFQQNFLASSSRFETWSSTLQLLHRLLCSLLGPGDGLCGLVVRSSGPGFVLGSTTFSEK